MQTEDIMDTVLPWDETEYRSPGRAGLKRKRQAWEEAEREGSGYGKYYSSDNTGECQDIMQL